MDKYMWFQDASMGVHSELIEYWSRLTQLFLGVGLENWLTVALIISLVAAVIAIGFALWAVSKTIAEAMEKVDGDESSDKIIVLPKD